VPNSRTTLYSSHKKEARPLKSVSEAAIAAGYAREDDENGDGNGNGVSLSCDTKAHESLALPSLRPSPPLPHGALRTRPSHIRARNVSH
jgi:hypothetical protein